MLQCGADGLADDPMSGLALSNRALWRVVRRLMGLAPRLLVLGGGGYNPWAVARCWAGVWATLNGIDPARPPPDRRGGAGARGLELAPQPGPRAGADWFTTIADPPNPAPCATEVEGAGGHCRRR